MSTDNVSIVPSVAYYHCIAIFNRLSTYFQRSTVLKDRDKNIIAATREGQYDLIVYMVENNGVPVDYQESLVSLTQTTIILQLYFKLL